MANEVSFNERSLCSVHYFVYEKGQLTGKHNDVMIRFNNISDLETLLSLDPKTILQIGKNHISYQKFKEEYLQKAKRFEF